MSRPREMRRRPSGTSRIASDRQEILDLIEQLRSRGKRRRSHRAPERRVLGPSLQALAADQRRSDSVLPSFMKEEAVVTLLRSLEVRLGLLEERMGRTERWSSRPAPPVSGERQPAAVAHTFAGIIQGQMLSDMLQLVSSNAMTGRFVVDDGERTCQLYFEQGRICHAKLGDIVGENAFFSAFAFESGEYHFDETADLPAERTINSSTQFLILEALRQIDESSA